MKIIYNTNDLYSVLFLLFIFHLNTKHWRLNICYCLFLICHLFLFKYFTYISYSLFLIRWILNIWYSLCLILKFDSFKYLRHGSIHKTMPFLVFWSIAIYKICHLYMNCITPVISKLACIDQYVATMPICFWLFALCKICYLYINYIYI